MDIDHEYTSQIVCPYCGYQDRDSWEHDDNDGEEIECLLCERSFTLEVHTVVTYTTKRLPCEGEHVWGEPEAVDITEAIAADWNTRRFLGRDNHTPYRAWHRKCVNCHHDDRAAYVEPGGACPWVP